MNHYLSGLNELNFFICKDIFSVFKSGKDSKPKNSTLRTQNNVLWFKQMIQCLKHAHFNITISIFDLHSHIFGRVSRPSPAINILLHAKSDHAFIGLIFAHVDRTVVQKSSSWYTGYSNLNLELWLGVDPNFDMDNCNLQKLNFQILNKAWLLNQLTIKVHVWSSTIHQTLASSLHIGA